MPLVIFTATTFLIKIRRLQKNHADVVTLCTPQAEELAGHSVPRDHTRIRLFRACTAGRHHYFSGDRQHACNKSVRFRFPHQYRMESGYGGIRCFGTYRGYPGHRGHCAIDRCSGQLWHRAIHHRTFTAMDAPPLGGCSGIASWHTQHHFTACGGFSCLRRCLPSMSSPGSAIISAPCR